MANIDKAIVSIADTYRAELIKEFRVLIKAEISSTINSTLSDSNNDLAKRGSEQQLSRISDLESKYSALDQFKSEVFPALGFLRNLGNFQELESSRKSFDHSSQDQLRDLNFDKKLNLFIQDLKSDMENSITAAIAKSVALMTNKPASTVGIAQENFQATNQQALQTQKEIESLKSQLSR